MSEASVNDLIDTLDDLEQSMECFKNTSAVQIESSGAGAANRPSPASSKMQPAGIGMGFKLPGMGAGFDPREALKNLKKTSPDNNQKREIQNPSSKTQFPKTEKSPVASPTKTENHAFVPTTNKTHHTVKPKLVSNRFKKVDFTSTPKQTSQDIPIPNLYKPRDSKQVTTASEQSNISNEETPQKPATRKTFTRFKKYEFKQTSKQDEGTTLASLNEQHAQKEASTTGEPSKSESISPTRVQIEKEYAANDETQQNTSQKPSVGRFTKYDSIPTSKHALDISEPLKYKSISETNPNAETQSKPPLRKTFKRFKKYEFKQTSKQDEGMTLAGLNEQHDQKEASNASEPPKSESISPTRVQIQQKYTASDETQQNTPPKPSVGQVKKYDFNPTSKHASAISEPLKNESVPETNPNAETQPKPPLRKTFNRFKKSSFNPTSKKSEGREPVEQEQPTNISKEDDSNSDLLDIKQKKGTSITYVQQNAQKTPYIESNIDVHSWKTDISKTESDMKHEEFTHKAWFKPDHLPKSYVKKVSIGIEAESHSISKKLDDISDVEETIRVNPGDHVDADQVEENKSSTLSPFKRLSFVEQRMQKLQAKAIESNIKHSKGNEDRSEEKFEAIDAEARESSSRHSNPNSPSNENPAHGLSATNKPDNLLGSEKRPELPPRKPLSRFQRAKLDAQ